MVRHMRRVRSEVSMREYRSLDLSTHIFAITSPPGGVHIFAWLASFRNFAPKPCIFSLTTPVRFHSGECGETPAPRRPCALAPPTQATRLSIDDTAQYFMRSAN